MSPRSDSGECFDRLRGWIKECDDGHAKCRVDGPTPLPSRVINIGRTTQGYKPFLHQSNGEAARYAALSYVWGADQPLTTTTSNFARHRKKIKWTSIPKTIQDAIVITDRLGLEYLWVDSLAIVQDDPADWATESARMDEIYSSAYITIAATASKGCRNGIFASRSAGYVSVWSPEDMDSRDANGQNGQIYARPTRYGGVWQYPLSTRAWALQEHLLSRRVIQYLGTELFWHCRECSALESGPKMNEDGWYYPGSATEAFRPLLLDTTSTPGAEEVSKVNLIWEMVAHNYSQRHLTRLSDRVVAISSLAQKFHPILGRYCFGLWEYDLLAGLTWASHPGSGFDSPRNRRLSPAIAPSWSWLSTMGQISQAWFRQYVTPENARCSVTSMDLHPSGAEGVLGSITIRGRILQGTLMIMSSKHFLLEDNSTSSTSGDAKVTIQGNEIKMSTDQVVYKMTDNRKKPTKPTTPPTPKTTILRQRLKKFGARSKTKDVSLPEDYSWDTQLPCEVHCLLLGSKPRVGYEVNSLIPDAALILKQSLEHSDCYERIGFGSGMLAKYFKDVPEQDIVLV